MNNVFWFSPTISRFYFNFQKAKSARNLDNKKENNVFKRIIEGQTLIEITDEDYFN